MAAPLTRDQGVASFPSRPLTRRQLVALLAGLACAPATLRLTDMRAPSSRIALAEPAERGAAETAALTQAQQEYDDARSQLQQIGRKLEQTQYDLSETTSKLDGIGKDITQTQSDIKTTTDDLTTAQNALAAYLVISYKSGATSTLDLLLQSTDFNDFVTRGYYVGRIQDSQVDAIADTAATTAKFGTSSIYAVSLGLNGFHGISPTGNKLITSYMPDLSKPGAVKTGEVELVAGVALGW